MELNFEIYSSHDGGRIVLSHQVVILDICVGIPYTAYKV